MLEHWAIFADNDSKKSSFIEAVLNNTHSEFKSFNDQKGILFSSLSITTLINEEERHGALRLNNTAQPLKTMSSGEQKKALLYHIFENSPDYIILDNTFDNLDVDFQQELQLILKTKANTIRFLQLTSRKSDTLSFIHNYGVLEKDCFKKIQASTIETIFQNKIHFNGNIPKPIESISYSEKSLIDIRNVSISYNNKKVLNNITWAIKPADFWQLTGKNGSGKSTLLSMIIGDNPKAYGKDIYLFGKKKGTGESVWDIKQKIGYFSPAMTDKFTGRHTLENMLISGFNDSIGLYTKPTDVQKRVIEQWITILNFQEKKNSLFKDLTLGEQRLVMTARAMVKHPPLLILDEPTAGMDDSSATLLVALVNKIASQSSTAIIFVSHRQESGLLPKSTYRLDITDNGSVGSSFATL